MAGRSSGVLGTAESEARIHTKTTLECDNGGNSGEGEPRKSNVQRAPDFRFGFALHSENT